MNTLIAILLKDLNLIWDSDTKIYQVLCAWLILDTLGWVTFYILYNIFK